MASSRRSTTRRQLIKPDSENAIQAGFFRWCDLMSKKYPHLARFFSVPNGAHKSPASRYVYKVTGLKPGVPDTFLPVARGGYHGLFIEFKSATGRLSPEQKEWIEFLKAENFLVEVCRDWEIAAKITEDYLNSI
jgi:hypothetical protein